MPLHDGKENRATALAEARLTNCKSLADYCLFLSESVPLGHGYVHVQQPLPSSLLEFRRQALQL